MTYLLSHNGSTCLAFFSPLFSTLFSGKMDVFIMNVGVYLYVGTLSMKESFVLKSKSCIVNSVMFISLHFNFLFSICENSKHLQQRVSNCFCAFSEIGLWIRQALQLGFVSSELLFSLFKAL